MTTITKPTFFKRLIAFIIVISFVTYHSNGAETHSLVSWAVGNSFGAMIIKFILLLTAFVLACATIYSTETE